MSSCEPLTDPAQPRRPHRAAHALLVIVLVLLVTAAMVWGTLFIRFSNLPSEPLRITLAGLFAIATVLSFLFVKKRSRTLLIFAGVFAALVIWFSLIPASNDRDWAPEVAVLALAKVNGQFVEIKNIRNFDYRTDTDFTPRYYDKTFDLNKLQSADLILVTWGVPGIAHIFVSFGFGGDDFVAFSIEMRPEKGEANSMVRSFFRNYELIYIVADERDVIRVRTSYRDPREQVHVFRTRLPVEDQRKLFLSYVQKVDELSRNPEWYNALEDNCTTGVLHRTESAYKTRGRYNWKVLLPGYVGEYAYELGMIDTAMPYPELSERCLVNAKAEAADKAADFSQLIRDGLPLPQPMTLEEFEAKP